MAWKLRLKILTIFGTRPEAIKMVPVIQALAGEPAIEVATCLTGQHRDMVRPILSLFDVVPRWDLDVMPGQSLNAIVARILHSIDPVFDAFQPDRVLVHGDTSSALAAAIGAFHRGIPLGHVEAGLRTHDLARPWPEEMNRRTIDGFADLLLPPTERARSNLLAEGLGQRRIVTTGNTGIDALFTMRAMLGEKAWATRLADRFACCAAPGQRVLVVTAHRRESFGDGFRSICRALTILARRGDIRIVFPLHPNPHVRGLITQLLGGIDRVSLIGPLDYPEFVWMMDRADVILTDSGGVQEEAPSLGTPVLVMREATERPEAVAAGIVRLVGTDEGRIVAAVSRLFDDADAYRTASRIANLYGDGRASRRIVDALLERPIEAFGSTA